jgi:hypothetical protein
MEGSFKKFYTEKFCTRDRLRQWHLPQQMCNMVLLYQFVTNSVKSKFPIGENSIFDTRNLISQLSDLKMSHKIF